MVKNTCAIPDPKHLLCNESLLPQRQTKQRIQNNQVAQQQQQAIQATPGQASGRYSPFKAS